MPVTDIYNFRPASVHHLTGGMPTEAQIKDAASEGVQVVINLATYHPGHSLPEEDVLVRSLDMDYHWIPVDWEHPTRADYGTFEKLMLSLGSDRKVLVHCMANYRATGFYSLFAERHLGWTPEQAEQFRQTIWQISDYPAWERLIQEIESETHESG